MLYETIDNFEISLRKKKIKFICARDVLKNWFFVNKIEGWSITLKSILLTYVHYTVRTTLRVSPSAHIYTG